jgi:hypothetical protein
LKNGNTLLGRCTRVRAAVLPPLLRAALRSVRALHARHCAISPCGRLAIFSDGLALRAAAALRSARLQLQGWGDGGEKMEWERCK